MEPKLLWIKIDAFTIWWFNTMPLWCWNCIHKILMPWIDWNKNIDRHSGTSLHFLKAIEFRNLILMQNISYQLEWTMFSKVWLAVLYKCLFIGLRNMYLFQWELGSVTKLNFVPFVLYYNAQK